MNLLIIFTVNRLNVYSIKCQQIVRYTFPKAKSDVKLFYLSNQNLKIFSLLTHKTTEAEIFTLEKLAVDKLYNSLLIKNCIFPVQ